MNSSTHLCPVCAATILESSGCTQCGYEELPFHPAICLPVGTALRGEYVVGNPLGKPGGFGITYLAWYGALAQAVAIKEYLPRELAGRAPDGLTVRSHSLDLDGDFRFGIGLFLQEARRLAQLRHPNIVRVRGFFEEYGTVYLVMDYYSGRSFDRLLDERGGRLPEREAIGLMLPILNALQYVHGKGLLHRDVKPSNLYLQDDQTPILLDFGAARSTLFERTQSASLVHTPGYSPLEQYLEGGRLGPWTDVYAAAATLYKLITGLAPPSAIKRAAQDELVPPELQVSDISTGCTRAILAGLMMEAAKRPQDAGGLRKLLSAPKRHPAEHGTPTQDHSGPGPLAKLRTQELGPKPSQAQAKAPGRTPIPLQEYLPLPAANQIVAPRLASIPIASVEHSLPSKNGQQRQPHLRNRQRMKEAGLVLATLFGALGLLLVIIQLYMAKKEVPVEVVETPASEDLRTDAVAGHNLVPSVGEARLNSIDGLSYVWVPPGSFSMGCTSGDQECDLDERPLRQVTISRGFWISTTEVTVKAYLRFAQSRVPKAPAFNARWGKLDHPIVNVDWDDARAYCAWAGGRLPSEAEWEYAARGGHTKGRFPWGNDPAVCHHDAKNGAIFDDDLRCHAKGTERVGSFKANPYGLFDMSGNVWEWCSDAWPGLAPIQRIVRGGSWNTGPQGLRVSYRAWHTGTTRSSDLGFRCARDRLSDS